MRILDIIDAFICKFLGVDKLRVTPDVLKRIGNKMILMNTESFKRHIHYEELDKFLSVNFSKLNEDIKQKLGVSMGKIIAKNLIVSFENISIKKEEI